MLASSRAMALWTTSPPLASLATVMRRWTFGFGIVPETLQRLSPSFSIGPCGSVVQVSNAFIGVVMRPERMRVNAEQFDWFGGSVTRAPRDNVGPVAGRARPRRVLFHTGLFGGS
jgi:hypothetical protein